MKVTEDNYLDELRKKNQEALAFIITSYGGLVMSIVQKHLYLMKEKQEECFDDVFLSVWYHIERYDEMQNSFKNWIAAVAKNQSIDYLRKYKRELEELYLTEEHEKEKYFQLIPLIDNEISEDLESMLSCLDYRDQELLRKIYLDQIQIGRAHV